VQCFQLDSTLQQNYYQSLSNVRRTFRINCANVKYIALVRSQLQYCSILWRSQLIKDITTIEHIQREPPIHLNYYKSRLQTYCHSCIYFALQDIMFFIKSLKSPTDNFNIYDHITFARGSELHQKLTHSKSQTNIFSNTSFLTE